MLNQLKNIANRVGFSFGAHGTLSSHDVHEARLYIESYWKRLERKNKKDTDSLIGLPKPYLVPASEPGHEFDFDEMYYWDSYFMVQGMLDKDHEQYKPLVLGILENLESMFKQFKVVPNASRTYLMGRSQPPVLTSFIFDIYNAYDMDAKWLAEHIAVAKHEYETVWMGKAKPHWRNVHKGLSRYYDINMLHDLAEAESGWDMTPRFNRRALDYLPVDLNCLLYKYEMDFARSAEILSDQADADEWTARANARAKTVNELMWDKLRGLYYDYDYKRGKRGNVSSLAPYYALWSGLADKKRAQAMVKALKRFENKGGLATTDALPIKQYVPGSTPTQWAYPNGWAPLHFIAVQGLEKYGYSDDAHRIAHKWLKTNVEWFKRHGVFLEKYNVVDPEKPPAKGVYPSQTGFGWTNAVFERFCQDYIDK